LIVCVPGTVFTGVSFRSMKPKSSVLLMSSWPVPSSVVSPFWCERDRLADDRAAGAGDAVVVVVDVVVGIAAAGRGQAAEQRAAAGEVGGVDADDVVARRQVGEAVQAAAGGSCGGELDVGPRIEHAVGVGVGEQGQRDAVDAGVAAVDAPLSLASANTRLPSVSESRASAEAGAENLGVAVDGDEVAAADRAGVVESRDDLVGEGVDRRIPLDGDGAVRRGQRGGGIVPMLTGDSAKAVPRHGRGAGAGEIVIAGQAALAGVDQAVHQLGAVAGAVIVAEPDLVAELVHDGGQQVDAHCRLGAVRRGQQRTRAAIFGIVAGSRVDEPVEAGGVVVDHDVAGGARTQIEPAERFDRDGHRAHRSELFLARAGRGPAIDRRIDDKAQFGLAEHAVVDDRRLVGGGLGLRSNFGTAVGRLDVGIAAGRGGVLWQARSRRRLVGRILVPRVEGIAAGTDHERQGRSRLAVVDAAADADLGAVVEPLASSSSVAVVPPVARVCTMLTSPPLASSWRIRMTVPSPTFPAIVARSRVLPWISRLAMPALSASVELFCWKTMARPLSI
jgi:hypothetical protein